MWAETGGWTNENTIAGNGSIAYSSTGPSAVGAYAINIDRAASGLICNGNKVNDVSVESARLTTGKPSGTIYVNAFQHVFSGLRYEGFDQPHIKLGPDSAGGGNTFVGGRGLHGHDSIDSTLSGEKYIVLGQHSSHFGGGSVTPATPTFSISEHTTSANTQLGIKDTSGVTRFKVSSLALTLGNTGTPIVRHLSGSKTWDPGSVASGAQITTTVTITGAVVGDPVMVGFSQDLQGMVLTAYISSSSTATVVLRNNMGSAIDLASGTLRVSVNQYV
jgi:hypothetical protein